MKIIPDIIHDSDLNHFKFIKPITSKVVVTTPVKLQKDDGTGYPWSEYEDQAGFSVSPKIKEELIKKNHAPKKEQIKEQTRDSRAPILLRKFEKYDVVRGFHPELSMNIEATVIDSKELPNGQISYILEPLSTIGLKIDRFETVYCFPI